MRPIDKMVKDLGCNINEEVGSSEETIKTVKKLQELNYTKKPDDWEEFKKIRYDLFDKDELTFIQQLPVIYFDYHFNYEKNGPLSIRFNKNKLKQSYGFCVFCTDFFSTSETYFLVNTEYYDYPRYMIKLVDFPNGFFKITEDYNESDLIDNINKTNESLNEGYGATVKIEFKYGNGGSFYNDKKIGNNKFEVSVENVRINNFAKHGKIINAGKFILDLNNNSDYKKGLKEAEKELGMGMIDSVELDGIELKNTTYGKGYTVYEKPENIEVSGKAIVSYNGDRSSLRYEVEFNTYFETSKDFQERYMWLTGENLGDDD